jgi:hypothetical protein
MSRSVSGAQILALQDDALNIPESVAAAEAAPVLTDFGGPPPRASSGSKSESVRVASAKARQVFAM